MRNIFNSLWARLIVGYAIPVILFLGAALVSYITIERLIRALDREQYTREVLEKAYTLKANINAMAASQRAQLLQKDEELNKRFLVQQNVILADLDSLQNLIENRPHLLVKLNDVSAMVRSWFELANQDLVVLEQFIGKDLRKLVEGIRLKENIRLVDEIDIRTDEIITYETTNLSLLKTQVERTTKESIYAILIAITISIVLSIGIALLTARSITKPIHQLQLAINRLRIGEFQPISPFGPGEILELVRGFNLMGVALSERTNILQDNERRYRTIVGTTSSILWMTDSLGNNTSMSSWCTYTGQKEEDVLGEAWIEAIHPEDRDHFIERWKEAVGNLAYAEDELRIRKSTGEYRHFSCRSVPIFDANNKVSEWVRICTDITERKREEELRNQKEAAEASNRAKSEFLAKMSHELRTPLNAVIGMSRMLCTQKFGALNAKQLDYLSDINQAGEHLLSLINDILDLSKVEAGRMELIPEPVPLKTTIELVMSTLRTLAANKNLQLVKDLPVQEGTIITDQARFRQILYNLLSNAVKFTNSEGTVTLCCRWISELHRSAPECSPLEAKAIRVDIKDTGIGISKDDQEKLGSEFFQARNKNGKASEGTGLGLALTRRLVSLMGGLLWFTSEPDVGSCFSFLIPIHLDNIPGIPFVVVPPPPLQTHCQHQNHLPPAPGSPLALIIDDHHPTNKLMADWLHDAGLSTASAYDGRSGVERARELKPQLIVLDICLPRLNGLQVLTTLKGQPETAEVPIVVVSVLEGHDQPRELDVVDWFVKPLEKERFLRTLRHSCPELFTPHSPIVMLMVEKDNSSQQLLKDVLKTENVIIISAQDAAETIAQLEQEHPNLVLIDLLLPDTNCFAVVEAIRQRPEWEKLPIIILTEEEISHEDLERLHGNIQAILRKESLTREKLISRLEKLGISLESPRPG